jgi:hypothetical protein
MLEQTNETEFHLDWGPESENDQFCFLCDSDPELLQKDHGGQWLHMLKKMIDDGAHRDYTLLHSGSLYATCVKISQYLTENILPHQKDQREWTLRSIQSHLVSHYIGLDFRLQGRSTLDVLRNIQARLIDKLKVYQTLTQSHNSRQKSKEITLCLKSMEHTYMHMILLDRCPCTCMNPE